MRAHATVRSPADGLRYKTRKHGPGFERVRKARQRLPSAYCSENIISRTSNHDRNPSRPCRRGD